MRVIYLHDVCGEALSFFFFFNLLIKKKKKKSSIREYQHSDSSSPNHANALYPTFFFVVVVAFLIRPFDIASGTWFNALSFLSFFFYKDKYVLL